MNLATQILDSLKQAEQAHHQYEEEELGGLRDNNWAKWYAAYLTANYSIYGDVPENTLESELVRSTANKEQEDAKMSWEEYTTQHLIDNFSFIVARCNL